MSDKTALVVIDMQEDYLRENRKKMFSYDTDALVTSVNRAIAVYREQGCDVLYVKQVFQNIITNRVFIGFTIKGTPGAEIYSGVDVVSEMMFEKYFSDTFSAKSFREHVAEAGYTGLVLCGLDECGCVGATAKGAVKAGVVYITTMAAALATASGIRSEMRAEAPGITSLQEFHARITD